MSYFIEIQNRCQQLWQRLYFWGTNTNSCGHECCESNQPRGIPRFLIYQSRLWKNVLLSNLGYSLTPAISKERMWFFPLFPYTNYYEKKKQTEESDKVPRLQEWRGIHRKRKRRKHSIEGTPYFFFFISNYSNFMSVNNIWVDTDEPIFPYIPAICCGVSPVL